MAELEIKQRLSEANPDVVVLTLVGNVDTFTADAVTQRVRELISNGWTKILIDLSEVEFVSSAGWGSLIGSLKRTHEAGGDLVLAEMKGQVKRVFKMMGFRYILKSYNSEAEALSAFG